ncbi:MAG: hypothetical protein HYU64_21975 [Armatimonadetes bacterium]|nr:hypothetical protein [Armatimonadota bacterium]
MSSFLNKVTGKVSAYLFGPYTRKNLSLGDEKKIRVGDERVKVTGDGKFEPFVLDQVKGDEDVIADIHDPRLTELVKDQARVRQLFERSPQKTDLPWGKGWIAEKARDAETQYNVFLGPVSFAYNMVVLKNRECENEWGVPRHQVRIKRFDRMDLGASAVAAGKHSMERLKEEIKRDTVRVELRIRTDYDIQSIEAKFDASTGRLQEESIQENIFHSSIRLP